MFAEMPTPPDQPLVPPAAPPYVVGVTGGSGSGKTTFVRALRERLGTGATFFSQDDYYVDIADVVTDGDGVHNFDLPASIDSAAMAADIGRVAAGDTLHRTEYTFQTKYAEGQTEQSGRVGQAIVLRPARVIVVEGLFVMHEPALSGLMNLKVFVDASDVAKMTRRIKRDRVERQLPLEDVLYRYERHVLPAYRQYLEPYRYDCDLILSNEAGFGEALEVLVSFLRGKVRAPRTPV